MQRLVNKMKNMQLLVGLSCRFCIHLLFQEYIQCWALGSMGLINYLCFWRLLD
jgi:hypothetical protein